MHDVVCVICCQPFVCGQYPRVVTWNDLDGTRAHAHGDCFDTYHDFCEQLGEL